VTVELAEDLREAADALRSGRVQQLTGDQRSRLAGAAQAVADALGQLAASQESVGLPSGKSA
jgi:hypothetical protein